MWVTWWSLLDIVCDYNGLIHYYDIVGYTMVSLTSLTLWVAQWFLLFIRRCRWLQWSIYPFITLYTIITSDGETRYDLSIPLDCFTSLKNYVFWAFLLPFQINANYIKDYLYTLDFLSTIYTHQRITSYLYRGYFYKCFIRFFTHRVKP